MHPTASRTGRLFLDCYASTTWRTAVEIGAMDVNGGLRSAFGDDVRYIGVDVSDGPSVDVVTRFGQPLPFADDFADCVLSSSQMEHDDFFWMTFLDVARITKPGGCIYINAPSNGPYHRFPNDNWRFYPDCGHVLARWAKSNGLHVELMESFVSDREDGMWCDFVGIFIKGETVPAPSRFVADEVPCRNVWKFGAAEPERFSAKVEDMEIQLDYAIKAAMRQDEIDRLTVLVAKLESELVDLKRTQP